MLISAVINALVEDTVITCTGRLKDLASELGLGVCQAEEGGKHSWQCLVCAKAQRHKRT